MFQHLEPVAGKVFLNLPKKAATSAASIDHMGVRIECIGMIVNLSDPTRNSTFLTLWKDVEPPGQLTEDSDYEFEF